MRVIQMSAASPPPFSRRGFQPPRQSYAAPPANEPPREDEKAAFPWNFLFNGRGEKLHGFLSKLEKDDYILAGLIIVLIFEGCDDYILILALGYLLLMGFLEEEKS